MQVAIFGAGPAGKHLFNEIRSSGTGYKVLAFIDNLVDGSYMEIPIMSPSRYFAQYSQETEAVFIAAGAQKTIQLMLNTLWDNGVEIIYLMQDIAGKCKLKLFKDGQTVSRYLYELRKSTPILPYIEVPVTDKCNLNCKGCLFACNAIGQNEDVPTWQVVSDLRRMKEVFGDIPWIRILGGEPLLHPQLLYILGECRKVFPKSEVDILTNGLLFPKLPESFFGELVRQDISIHISGYKPTLGILDQIGRTLSKHKLNYTILEREEFVKYYTTEPLNSMEESYKGCMVSACTELYRGRLSRCSAAIAFEKLNSQFGTGYSVTKDEDWYDIYEEDINAEKIICALQKPSYICKYCTPQKKSFEWDYAGSRPELADYVIM